jgi:hypothetical protein
MSMVDDVLTEKDQLFAVPVGESLQRVTTTMYLNVVGRSQLKPSDGRMFEGNRLYTKTMTGAGEYGGQRASGKCHGFKGARHDNKRR